MTESQDGVLKANTAEYWGDDGSTAHSSKRHTAASEVVNAAAAARVRSGADWFFWIAGMSVVNSVATLFGSTWQFVLGLGVTQIVDAVAAELGGAAQVVALLSGIVPVAFFAVMGYLARRGRRWPFVVGMLAFAVDGVVVLLLQNVISAAFHAYALYRIYGGFRAARQIHEPSGGRGLDMPSTAAAPTVQ